MDIVDNSISAGASEIVIELVTRAGTTNSTVSNVEMFRIYDNGIGMRPDEIETALEIGSDVVYPEHSLSKFGFGLKSAGFSLGRCILVNGKSPGGSIATRYVDRDVIRERHKYGVCRGLPSDEAETWLRKTESGTVVEITKTPDRQDSAATIRRELAKRLGVTYCDFLSQLIQPLRMSVVIGKDVTPVQPIDILFWDEASPRFDPDNYDGKRPCRVFDGVISHDLLTREDIKLQATVFPMDKMKSYPAFTDEERRKITQYAITRENCGIFFYRNGRLIRWGDKVAGVSRDDLGFRARVDFNTAHDDLFHVDVSKQNIELNEEFEQKLDLLCRLPIANSKQAFKLCRKMLDAGTETEGEAFNARTEVFEETDPTEDFQPIPVEEKVARRAILEHQTRDRELREGADERAEPEDLPPLIELFERIRYTDKIIGLDLAVPGTDHSEGTFVRINKNHSFYDTVMKFFGTAEPARLALEALLFAAAVAETKTCENLGDLSFEQLSRVFGHYRKVFSQNLDAWANMNQDLYE